MEQLTKSNRHFCRPFRPFRANVRYFFGSPEHLGACLALTLIFDTFSYVVREGMQLDLELLLRTRHIQEEFVQFFLYQIMACSEHQLHVCANKLLSAELNIFIRQV